MADTEDTYLPTVGASYGGLDLGRTARQISIREQYLTHMKYHESEIERYKELLDLLDRNPDFERFMNLHQGRL